MGCPDENSPGCKQKIGRRQEALRYESGDLHMWKASRNVGEYHRGSRVNITAIDRPGGAHGQSEYHRGKVNITAPRVNITAETG